jgi:malic enzyme
MKCIENSPIRNSLIPKDVGAGSAAAKTIEMLKKEIMMRDIIAIAQNSGSVLGGMTSADVAWLPDLTRHQRIKTVKEVIKRCIQTASLILYLI